MCYTLAPASLFAYILIHSSTSSKEISFRWLKDIRKSIEEKNKSIYVEITSREVINAVHAFSDLLELHDTKIVVHHKNLDKVRDVLEKNVKSLPEEYKLILESVI